MRILDPGWENFGSGIRDGKTSDPGSGMEKNLDPGKEKIRIRDKHPGSATLITGTSSAMVRLIITISDVDYIEKKSIH